MSKYKLADGTETPEPIRREVHRYGFYKSSESRHVDVLVVETEYTSILILTAECKIDGWEFLSAEFLAGIVALRVEQGNWRLMSMSDTAATFRKIPSRSEEWATNL